MTVTPAANQSGTATITLTVTDGNGGTASDTFVLTVTAVNDAPTISDITDQTTNEDTATAAHQPSRSATWKRPAASLTLTAQLVEHDAGADGNIVFGGSGASRTVTVTPAANQSGTATITLTVTDGNGGTASDTFVVTVTAVNDAPTISDVADQTTNEDTATAAPDASRSAMSRRRRRRLTLTGSSSNTTLVPTANIVFGGSGASRTVTVTPAANQIGHRHDHGDGDGRQRRHGERHLRADGDGGQRRADDLGHHRSDDERRHGDGGDLAFTVGDVETAAAALTVTRQLVEHRRWCRRPTSSSAAAARAAR